jgi:hypothetical protein
MVQYPKLLTYIFLGPDIFLSTLFPIICYLHSSNRLVHHITYEAYAENKFRLQILLLQRCGHYGVRACRVYWSFGRRGRNLQTIKPSLHIILSVKMFKKIEKPATCEMRSVTRFLNARNMKLADIHRQLCKVYRKHAMSEHSNEGRENVHDDPQSHRLSVVNEDLVRAVEEKTQENKRFTILSLSLHFPRIS